MTANKVKPVSGTPAETSFAQDASRPQQREGTGSPWCLPGMQAADLSTIAMSGRPVSNAATATNPATGQKVIYKNGQWQPAS